MTVRTTRGDRERGVPAGSWADLVQPDHPMFRWLMNQQAIIQDRVQSQRNVDAIARADQAARKQRRRELWLVDEDHADRTVRLGRMLPTAEREQKGDVGIGEHQIGRERIHGHRGAHETPLARYHREGLISRAQRSAGNRLFAEWKAGGGGVGRLTGIWGDPPSPGRGEMSRRQIEARDSYMRAIRAVPKSVVSVLVHVVLIGETAGRWAVQNGRHGRPGEIEAMTKLRVALSELSDHYISRKAA